MDLNTPSCQRPQHWTLNVLRPLLILLNDITLAPSCQALCRAMWREKEAVGRQFNLSGSYSVWLKFWAQKSPPGIKATLMGYRTLSWNYRPGFKTRYITHSSWKWNACCAGSPKVRPGFVTSLASAGDGGFRNVSFEPGVHHHGGLTFIPTHLLHLPRPGGI